MKNDELLNSELKALEVVCFILKQYDQNNIDRNLEVCSELIIISKLIMQRYKMKYGIFFKKNRNLEKVKKIIINEIKKDKIYPDVLEIINNYRKYKKKSFN